MKRETIVLSGAAVLFLWFLGAHDLWAPDEPFFGEGAREMLIDGQWLVSHVNGVVNSHKPPLFFWLIAIFSLPIGAVTEFTARLPSVLAALGTLWLTMRIGRRWYGPKTAALAGFILATAFMFWDKARWSQIDSLLCCLIWVALSAFEGFRSGNLNGRRAGMLFWLAVGLAVLAKGPVGLLLPLGITLITLAVDRKFSSWSQFAPILGPLVFVAVVGSWVAAVSLWGPAGYSVLGALREHFVERGIHGMHHAQPFWYFFDRLTTSMLPWSGLIPGALYWAWKRRAIKTDSLALVTCIFVFLFFSISTEKRDLYMLPAFPAWALLMASLVGSVCRLDEPTLQKAVPHRRWVTLGLGVIAGVITLVGVALPVAGRSYDEIPFWMVCILAAVFFLMGVLSLIHAFKGRALNLVLVTGLGMCVAYLFTASLIYPIMEPVKSARKFAVRIKEVSADSRAAGHRVMAWRLDNLANAFAYYSDGAYTYETRDPGALLDHMTQNATVYAVVLETDLTDAMLDKLAHSWIIDETRLSRRDLLLISNTKHSEGRSIRDLE
ncbi:MAG: glycosyltransferase family 39 protein [Verrucomicrobia bacterium]|nr:glycosyltransferase family 39 protein [Verrucomicrobiota bacterium]